MKTDFRVSKQTLVHVRGTSSIMYLYSLKSDNFSFLSVYNAFKDVY